MSFLRVATLLAAVTTLLMFLLNTSNLIVTNARYVRMLVDQGGTAWLSLASFLVSPIHLLALGVFFIALFARQKG